MTNDIATTLRTWKLSAERGESVELSAEWLENIASEIDLLEGVIRSLQIEKRQDKADVARLEAAAANREYRRAS